MKEEFEEQLMSTESRIKKYFHHDANGNLIKWFRPGHGFYNESILKTCEAHGYRVALGSIFPLDHMFQKQAKLLVQNVLWRVHPGAVIILHDRVPQWEQTPEVNCFISKNAKANVCTKLIWQS
jgi:peptidoglycan/xylan/chitin deacetylase (PgdA/CDA1 family)